MAATKATAPAPNPLAILGPAEPVVGMRITVRLTREQHQALQKLAAEAHITTGVAARRLIALGVQALTPAVEAA